MNNEIPERPNNVPAPLPKLSPEALRAAYPKDYYRIYGKKTTLHFNVDDWRELVLCLQTKYLASK